MKAEERMKAWEQLTWPKPDWETFKRMLPSCKNNPLVVKTIWLRKNGQKKIDILN